jgi:hypothetical protein
LDVFTNRLSADPIQLAEVADEAFGLPSAPDPEFWPRSGSHRPWSRVAV